ncbi:hypothetical protein C7974DRAFT_184026 [Boeremia exigua]|uniref:uncharacterized protein n=1 Tax=Boeremia exigua TaxID=749465 RepID=UPI001E8D21B8|nr:uncharacterized protein C7974DRAFT_184026 [Boeremia exigua]KAH6629274.1 hypothetical protein C7974DRAFT_184026 [Boeremia exigua]
MQCANAVYEELFDALRTRDRCDVGAIVQQVRSGADADTILKRIRTGDLLLQLALAPETRYRYEFPYLREIPAFLLTPDNPYSNTVIHEYTPRRSDSDDQTSMTPINVSRYGSAYWTPHHAARYVDANLERVKPSMWTSVSSDDSLMREMLGLYFGNEYQGAPFFQKDYFLEDMAAGRRQYCSPLLVNAILAVACHSYTSHKDRVEFWNCDTLCYRFLAESRRFLELELLKPTLTTVQALLLLQIVACFNGADGVGYHVYMTQAVKMAIKLRLLEDLTNAGRKEQNARNFTAWVLYAWQGLLAYQHHLPPLITAPPVKPLPHPVDDRGWYGEIAYKFPASPTLHVAHFGPLFKALVEIWTISLDIAARYCTESSSMSELSIPDVCHYYTKLMQWESALPEFLKPHRIVTPYQLQLHMWFKNTVIKLLEEPMTTRLEGPDHLTDVLNYLGSHPRAILAETKRHFETIIRIFYLRHGFEAMNMNNCHFLSLFAFVVHAAIQSRTSDSQLQSFQSSVVLAATGLRNQCHSTYVARMVFHAVRGAMGPELASLIDKYTEQGSIKETEPPEGWEPFTTWTFDSGSIADDKETLNLGKLFDAARLSDVPKSVA